MPVGSSEFVTELRALDSCSVSDALDMLNLPGALTSLRPMWPVSKVMAGRVRTVKAAPKTKTGPATHIATPLVEVAESGDVIVIDNNGRTDVSCWGGLLAEAATQRGIEGVVVNGACRDVQESEALDLPLFALSPVPVSARGRIIQQDMDIPIQVSGVAVNSYDYVIADTNGVVFVPRDHIEKVVSLARRINDRELAMAQAVRAGQAISNVMHDSKFPMISVE